MSDYDRNVAAFPGARAGQSVAVDAGLRAHMIRVYNYMATAVGLTGVVAWFTFNAAVVTNEAGRVALNPFRQKIFGGFPPVIPLLADARRGVFLHFPVPPATLPNALGPVHLHSC